MIINEAILKKKKAYVEILMDNDLFPVYNTRVSEADDPYWGEGKVKKIMSRDLTYLNLTKNIFLLS